MKGIAVYSKVVVQGFWYYIVNFGCEKEGRDPAAWSWAAMVLPKSAFEESAGSNLMSASGFRVQVWGLGLRVEG